MWTCSCWDRLAGFDLSYNDAQSGVRFTWKMAVKTMRMYVIMHEFQGLRTVALRHFL